MLGVYELNRLHTGDAMEMASGIPDGAVGLAVLDPPYNCGKDYGPYWDDSKPEEEYLEWYGRMAEETYRVMGNGYVYVSCTVPQLWTLRPLWEGVGFSWVMLLIWEGANYANGATIRSQWRMLFEPIMMLLKGPRLPMVNAFPGVNTSSVLRYARPQSNYTGNQRRVHIVQKPVGLYEALIARTPGRVVLDWFVGSGSVLMAAKSLGRDWIGFEINPGTAEIARARLDSVSVRMGVLVEMVQPELVLSM